MYSLWNGGWADDAKAWDVANNTAYDPEKIKRFDFEGKIALLRPPYVAYNS